MLNLLRKIISYDNPIRKFWHWLKGISAALINGFPGRNIVVIGITGTNGKTTTTHITEHLLRSAGKKVAMISTVALSINGEYRPNKSKKTTLSPFVTQKFLKKCIKNKVDYVVIEASSHALHQYRLIGIPFTIAAITNITHEHLDYHGTMQKYADAKKILFKTVSKYCNKKELPNISQVPHIHAFVLNTADKFYQDFSKIYCSAKTSYGINNGDLQAKKVSHYKYSSKFSLNYQNNVVEVNLNMPGEFNIENALAASSIALNCKLTLEEIKKGLKTFKGVPGRMERISSPKGFSVIVDFALTPDALEKLYKTLKQSAPGRLIGIIGSCGDRDKTKRPEMGRIVAKHTDITIITDEEPYSENPIDIMNAVLKGAQSIKKLDDDLFLIEDRYNAIDFAIKNAKENDIIVVTGMGNFSTRMMNDGPMQWDDREVVRGIINKYA